MKKDIQIISLVTTHNPINKIISPFVRQLNKILKTDDNMYQAMLNVTLINCMRQPQNLRRIRCIIVRPKWQHRRSQLQNAKTCVVQHVHILNWVLHLILGERIPHVMLLSKFYLCYYSSGLRHILYRRQVPVWEPQS